MALAATEDIRIPRSGSSLEVAEYFAPQRTSSSELPDPLPLVKNLTIGVLEVLAGVRDVDQLARWLGEDAYRALVTRANLSARARSARGVAAVRPAHQILTVAAVRPAHQILTERTCEPSDGALEAVVVVSGPVRTRAIAMRLEGWDGRWRATSLALL